MKAFTLLCVDSLSNSTPLFWKVILAFHHSFSLGNIKGYILQGKVYESEFTHNIKSIHHDCCSSLGPRMDMHAYPFVFLKFFIHLFLMPFYWSGHRALIPFKFGQWEILSKNLENIGTICHTERTRYFLSFNALWIFQRGVNTEM